MGGNEGREGKEEVMQLDFNLEKQNKNLKRYQFCFSFCGALLYRREEEFCFISCANIFFCALQKYNETLGWWFETHLTSIVSYGPRLLLSLHCLLVSEFSSKVWVSNFDKQLTFALSGCS